MHAMLAVENLTKERNKIAAEENRTRETLSHLKEVMSDYRKKERIWASEGIDSESFVDRIGVEMRRGNEYWKEGADRETFQDAMPKHMEHMELSADAQAVLVSYEKMHKNEEVYQANQPILDAMYNDYIKAAKSADMCAFLAMNLMSLVGMQKNRDKLPEDVCDELVRYRDYNQTMNEAMGRVMGMYDQAIRNLLTAGGPDGEGIQEIDRRVYSKYTNAEK